MLIKKYCPKHEKKHDADSVFMRHICVHIFLILLSLACLCGTTYALFGISTTTGTNTVKTYDYALSFALDGNTETVYMGSQKTAAYDSVGTHTLIISSLPDAPTGFCIITVEDTDDGGNPRTTNYYTTQLGGDSGSDSLTITLNVLSEGTVTIKPHWGIYSNYDALSAYTTVNGSQIDIGTTPVPVYYNTFTHSDNFANVDTYLYRVGNGNSVALGSLFTVATAGGGDVNSSNVKITVQSVDNGTSVSGSGTNLEAGSTANCFYTINNSDWTQSTLKFTGEGPVKVTIQEGAGDPYTLNLEVVNAMNVTATTVASLSNVVLLHNVGISDGGGLSFSGAVYGNGFTVDVQNGRINQPNGFVCDAAAGTIIDNIKLIGKEFITATGTTQGSDYAIATLRIGADCTITNSYISGCRTPLSQHGGVLNVRDTVVANGSFATIEFQAGTLNLHNVTTVNQPHNVTVDGTTTSVVGLGIVANSVSTSTGKINITGYLKQYNWVSQADCDSIQNSSEKTMAKSIFTDNNYAAYLHNVNGTKYLNAGIISMSEGFGADQVTGADIIGYSGQNVTVVGLGQSVSGYVWSYKSNNYTQTGDELRYHSPNSNITAAQVIGAQGSSFRMPAFDFTGSDLTVEGGQIKIEYESGSNATITNAQLKSIFAPTKYGKDLSYTITMDVDDCTNSDIVFNATETQSYTITYTVTDNLIYDGDVNLTDKEYQFTKSIEVYATVTDPQADPPTFTFYYRTSQGTLPYTDAHTSNFTGTFVETGTKEYYVSGNVSAQDDNIGSTTVNGQTIYYPIVEGINVRTGNTTDYDFQRYYPIFKGATIVDGDNTYSYSGTTEMPDTLVIIEKPTTGNSSAGLDTVYTTYSDKLCIAQKQKGNTEYGATDVWKYKYTALDGNTYYYYVGYKFYDEEETGSGGGCVATGTIITLADGTKKAIEDVTMDDTLLAFDHESGKFVASPILFIEYDGESEYQILNLEFSNGVHLRYIYEHGLFDLTLNKYVYITEDTISDYIGHEFSTGDGVALDKVTLVNTYITTEYTGCYELPTAYTINYYTDGFLSMPGGITGLFNYFEFGENLKYDDEQMQRDIETYGLLTYEDLADLVSEEAFEVYNGKYLLVSMGKGLMSYEDIMKLAERYGCYV